jgi:hypothetical protein
LVHQSKVQSSTIPNFVIHVIQATSEQDMHGFLDLGVLLPKVGSVFIKKVGMK